MKAGGFLDTSGILIVGSSSSQNFPGTVLEINGCCVTWVFNIHVREDEFSYAVNSTDSVALGLKVMAGFAL